MTMTYHYPGGRITIQPLHGGWAVYDAGEMITRGPVSMAYARRLASQRCRERGGVPPGRGRSPGGERRDGYTAALRECAAWLSRHDADLARRMMQEVSDGDV